MEIHKIVLTGGPCAGKTTARSWIQNSFERLGYRVLFIPEAYTELDCGGISSGAFRCNLDFQLPQFWLQLENEKVYERSARLMDTDKVLIVCDRGTIDNKPYMTEDEFDQILRQLGMTEEEMRNSYDAVFHMVTAANGAAEFYTLSNNQARTESPQEAIVLDDRLIEAWKGHPYLRIIDNSGSSFEEKLQQLLCEIRIFLGEPLSHSFRRRCLISMPDVAALEKLPNCRRVDISQTFLKCPAGKELRISRRRLDGICTLYNSSEKTLSSSGHFIETEQRLTRDEYLEMLSHADPALRTIQKSRYYLSENSVYFEIDVYPFWQDKAILEIDLESPDERVDIPDFLHIIADVTHDEAYDYRALAGAEI